MRILHVIQELRTGGAERVALSLAAGARGAGHDVAIAARPGDLDGEFQGERFPLPLVERRPWRLPAAARAISRSIRAWKPDLVHAHNPGMAAATALATRRGRSVASIVSFHGVPDADYPAAARALRLAGIPVVACGPGVAAALADHDLTPAATIVNGVAPAPPAADRGELGRELGIGADGPLLVSAGRLVEQKNHALAIRALRHVPGATLAVFGDGPLRDRIEAEAAASGVRDRVVLAGVRRDLRAVIGAADVFVLPSRWEGLPLVLLEALAAGTPVVATAVRGVRELLEGTGAATLVPPDDADALGAAIRELVESPELRATRAGRGRDVARTHSEDAMVERYLELYERARAQR